MDQRERKKKNDGGKTKQETEDTETINVEQRHWLHTE